MVTLEHVRINILTGTVTIVGLNAKEENAKDDFLSFHKLNVQLSLPRLLGKTVRINHIRLDQLNAQVIQNGIRFNFSDIIDFYTKDRKPKQKKGPSKWLVDIRHIRVRDAAIKYQDVRAGSLFDTKDVNIHVPKLDLNGGPSHLDMTTAFRQGGNFAINGNYNIKKGDFDAHVLMHQLSTDLGRPYLNLLSHFGTINGLLDGDATLKGCVKEIEKMVFSGTLSLNNVQAHNADQSPLASFKSFNMNIEKADLGKKVFNIKSIELKDPVFNFDIYADGNTFSRMKGGRQTDTLWENGIISFIRLCFLQVSRRCSCWRAKARWRLEVRSAMESVSAIFRWLYFSKTNRLNTVRCTTGRAAIASRISDWVKSYRSNSSSSTGAASKSAVERSSIGTRYCFFRRCCNTVFVVMRIIHRSKLPIPLKDPDFSIASRNASCAKSSAKAGSVTYRWHKPIIFPMFCRPKRRLWFHLSISTCIHWIISS